MNVFEFVSLRAMDVLILVRVQPPRAGHGGVRYVFLPHPFTFLIASCALACWHVGRSPQQEELVG